MYHKIKFASDLPMQLTVGDSKSNKKKSLKTVL